MGPNTTISWNNVTNTEELDNELDSISKQANKANTAAIQAQSQATSAYNTSNDNLTHIKNLINGQTLKNLTGTFISGQSIYSPFVYAQNFTVYTSSGDNNENDGGSFQIFHYEGTTNNGFYPLNIYYSGLYDNGGYLNYCSGVGACGFKSGSGPFILGAEVTSSGGAYNKNKVGNEMKVVYKIADFASCEKVILPSNTTGATNIVAVFA